MRAFHWLALLLLIAACSTAPTTPTTTPSPTQTPQATATTVSSPLPTPTQLATAAPLPTAIPAAMREAVAAPQRTFVRVIHAAPSLAEVDAYLGEDPVAFRLGYLEASGRAEVTAGDYELRLVPVGGGAEGVTLVSEQITLEPDTSIVVVVMPDEQVQIFEEDDAPLPGDEARVQIIHAIEDGPATAIQNDDGTGRAFEPLAYGAQSAGVVYAAGERLFDFEEVLEGYNFDLRPRRVYTLVLAGDASNPQVIAADSPVPAQGEITFVNASEAADAVDIYLNGERVINRLGFRESDNFSQLPVNTYEVIAREAGADADSTPLLQARVVLNPDDEVFALLVGAAADAQLAIYRNQATLTNADQTRIAFINAVSDFPQLTELRDERSITVTYAQPTVIEFPSGVRDFEFVIENIDDDDAYETVDLIVERDFEAGMSYVVVLTGQGAVGDNPLIFNRVVGQEDAPEPEELDLPEEPSLYFVNAIDREVDLLVDGQVIENQVLPGTATDELSFAPLPYELTIVDTQSGESLYTANRTLETDEQYTLLLWGDLQTENYALSLFPVQLTRFVDAPAANASLRLLNVSVNSVDNFALGYARAVPVADRPTNLLATQAADGSRNQLIEVPPSVTGLTSLAVPSGQASQAFELPEGRYDLYVYDTNATEIMAVVYDADLRADQLYEVVVTGQAADTPHTAFLQRNPLR